MVSCDKGSSDYVFLLALKKTNMSSKRFFYFKLIIGFRDFFAFLEPMDWFNKVSKVFSSCFR